MGYGEMIELMKTTYEELEWAMNFQGNSTNLFGRQEEVHHIYNKLNKQNKHKMKPIPICKLMT